jgi:hypothetical protein
MPAAHVLNHRFVAYGRIYCTFSFFNQLRSVSPDLYWHLQWMLEVNRELVLAHFCGQQYSHSEPAWSFPTQVMTLRDVNLPEVVGRLYFRTASRYFGRPVAMAITVVRERLNTVPGRSLSSETTNTKPRRARPNSVASDFVESPSVFRDVLGLRAAKLIEEKHRLQQRDEF